ncbi:GNAT family N-acetyltransferase [Methylocystis heyeri]|uniref:GNAT family N-acetyltransferase n=1 Tax=Methylocystis heyeri TaxID=391905 RepID=A0A6B8KDM6_9HYPH|nr:GNAT family N-acetyltransferase [Methylocystis heyeri]QGM44520.1 GNAT family N-acetyltransferase [Methylocystis heyeri]
MACDEGFDQPTLQFSFQIDEAGESPFVAVLLAAEIAPKFGPRDERPFSILASDQQGVFIGGANGQSHWRWLYVRHFFVAPEWRRRGLGRRLMAQVEALARARECVGIYLDTFEESAARFYESCGFARCGGIENFPPGAARIYLKKELFF